MALALFRTESDQRINCPIRTNTQRFCLARAVHYQPAPHHPGTRQEPLGLQTCLCTGNFPLFLSQVRRKGQAMKKLVIATMLVLAACVSQEPIMQTVEVEEDSFSKEIRLTGILESIGQNKLPKDGYQYFLRSWIDRDTGKVNHQIYIANEY